MFNFKKRLKDDYGFMGPTHALSAIAIALLLLALTPGFVYGFLKTSDLLIVASFIIVSAGFALFPDFDNTQSTAISTLGVLGKGISKLMRSFAVFIYLAVKSRKDDPKPNPHRGFWHTLVSAFFIGFIVLSTTSLPFKISLGILHKDVTLGFLFALLWIYIAIIMACTGLFAKKIKKLKKNFITHIGIHFVAILFTLAVLILSPGTLGYSWLAFSAVLGYTVHILGDTLTIAGTPLLWPLKHKGKRWWTYRFLGVRAGGEIEKYIFIPVFISIIILSLIKIIFIK